MWRCTLHSTFDVPRSTPDRLWLWPAGCRGWRTTLRFAAEKYLDGRADAAQDRYEPPRPRAHPNADLVGRLIHSVDGVANRPVDALGFLIDAAGHAPHVVENRVDARHRRGELTLLQFAHQSHEPAVGDDAADARRDEADRLENADRGHDSERQVRGSQVQGASWSSGFGLRHASILIAPRGVGGRVEPGARSRPEPRTPMPAFSGRRSIRRPAEARRSPR
jgi:hypothetical protein